MRARTIVVSLAAVLSLSACSYLWTYNYRVHIDPSLGPSLGPSAKASVVMVQSPAQGSLANANTQATVPARAGERSHDGEGKTCCSPVEVVNLFAFLDLDGDGGWDPGEPWGADANNPVTIDKDGYVSAITIVADPGVAEPAATEPAAEPG